MGQCAVVASMALMALLVQPVGRAEKPEVEAAIDAARQWLELIDLGKIDESWESAAGYFKRAVTRDQWRQSMSAVRAPLGDLVTRELESSTYATTLPGAPDGEYVVIQFDTSFERKKQAVETVTPMRDADGVWRVSGYYIK